MVTHDRNYLFVSKTNTVHELANGDIDKEDIGESTYIVRGMKSYFKKPYGAFWISVVMDYDWNIVDVISEGENCIPKEEMIRRTWLDLSRVKRNSICY